MTDNFVQIIGYAASAFIVGSFLINKNIRLLRIVNGIGCLLFALYGYLDNYNIPVIIPNAFICLIQIYYLFIHKTESEE